MGAPSLSERCGRRQSINLLLLLFWRGRIRNVHSDVPRTRIIDGCDTSVSARPVRKHEVEIIPDDVPVLVGVWVSIPVLFSTPRCFCGWSRSGLSSSPRRRSMPKGCSPADRLERNHALRHGRLQLELGRFWIGDVSDHEVRQAGEQPHGLGETLGFRFVEIKDYRHKAPIASQTLFPTAPIRCCMCGTGNAR